MADVRPSHDQEIARAAPRARGIVRRLVRLAVALAAVLVLVTGLGFLIFAWRMPSHEVDLKRDADGIVVLTGGASRITDAIELLAAGRGKRLLISGAHPTTRAVEILRLNPEFESVVRCCVDLDRSLNTFGNAVETRRWAESQGFRSLIVVTSNYHMPRAMAELAHQLPNVALIAFPVVSDKLRAEPWWTSGASARLLASEYLKYLYARARIQLDPAPSEDEPGLLAALGKRAGIAGAR